MAAFIVVPFLWMIFSSLKTTNEIIRPEVTFFPRKFEWANYSKLFTGIKKIDQYGNEYEAFKPMPFHWMFFNTIVVGFFTTIGTVVTTILAAFAFSRLNFKGRELIFTIMLVTMMIPGEVFVITNYMTLSRYTGWIKSASHLKTMALIFRSSRACSIHFPEADFQADTERIISCRTDGTSVSISRKSDDSAFPSPITTIIILSMIGT